MPLTKLENGSWPHPARLPLGWGWSGQCTAPGHENEVPAQDVLENFCNLGYAGGCAWSPAQHAWDSIRFAVISRPNGNDRTAACEAPDGILHLAYVCECDHRPAGYGELEFDSARSVWLRRHSDARIQKMAECFLESCWKKPM
jgi:hypothetical protein